MAGAPGRTTRCGVRRLPDAVKELTGGRGVDLVVDPVGGDRFTDSLRCLAPDGRLLVIGFTAGEIPTVRVNRLLLNNIAWSGSAGARSRSRGPATWPGQWAELLPQLRSGALDPLISATISLRTGRDALATIDERRAPARSCCRSDGSGR